MNVELAEIPGLEQRFETEWRVRALVVDGKCPVLAALARWQRDKIDDYKAIMKVMRLAAQQERVHNPKHVKRSANPRHGNAYEMIAYTRTARLMFFYDNSQRALIVCTNEYEKSKGDQDAAFARCVTLRDIYLEHIENETKE